MKENFKLMFAKWLMVALISAALQGFIDILSKNGYGYVGYIIIVLLVDYWITKSVFKSQKNKIEDYNQNETNHENNTDTEKCYRGLDKAYFSLKNSSDFDYFLNSLQNKINIYRKLHKTRQ